MIEKVTVRDKDGKIVYERISNIGRGDKKLKRTLIKESKLENGKLKGAVFDRAKLDEYEKLKKGKEKKVKG